MYNEHADKGKTKHVVRRWRKGFFVVMQGEGNSRSRGQMLDYRCYGQHAHENESRTEIRREPYLYELFSS